MPSRASYFTIITAAIVDGLAPLITGLICLIPIMAAALGIIIWNLAVLISTFIGLIILFILGFYIGKAAKTNPWIQGLQTFVTGIGTAVAIILIQLAI